MCIIVRLREFTLIQEKSSKFKRIQAGSSGLKSTQISSYEFMGM